MYNLFKHHVADEVDRTLSASILVVGAAEMLLISLQALRRAEMELRAAVGTVGQTGKQARPARRRGPALILAKFLDPQPYVEFDFYNKVDLIRYFMHCENIDISLINTLHDRLLKNIEILYYLTSPSKKMLKDMGIYDGDIDQIVSVIGEDFTSIAELQLPRRMI